MWKMLKHIGQTHRRKLITTFSLVGLDNLLLLVYPVFGGWSAPPAEQPIRVRLPKSIPKSPSRSFWNSANEKYRILLLPHALPYRVSLSVFLKNTYPSLLLRWSPSSVHV